MADPSSSWDKRKDVETFLPVKDLFRFKWHCTTRWLQSGATRTWHAISPQSIRGAASEWSRGSKIDAAANTCLSCVVAVFNLVALLSADFLAVTFRYKRIFSIGTKGITTYNPSNLEVTNQVRMFSSVSCYMWLSWSWVHSCNRSCDVNLLCEYCNSDLSKRVLPIWL